MSASSPTPPAVAPDSTETLSGTFGGVRPPCFCNTATCNHTLDPLRSQGPMPTVAKGVKGKSSNAGQSYGGDRQR